MWWLVVTVKNIFFLKNTETVTKLVSIEKKTKTKEIKRKHTVAFVIDVVGVRLMSVEMSPNNMLKLRCRNAGPG